MARITTTSCASNADASKSSTTPKSKSARSAWPRNAASRFASIRCTCTRTAPSPIARTAGPARKPRAAGFSAPWENLFLILERQQHPRAVSRHLAVFDLQVLLHHLRDAQVAQSLGRSLYRSLCGVLPRSRARSDHFGDSVDSVGLGHRLAPLTSVAFADNTPLTDCSRSRTGSRGRKKMDLILWRHADAEGGSPDSARKLTERGREQARRVAAWLEPRLPRGCEILVSPAARAQQTAQALGVPFVTSPAVGTDARAGDIIAAAQWPARSGAVLIVGHQPTLGRVAAMLLSGAEADWDIGKGALWWFQHIGGETTLFAAIDPRIGRASCRE